MATTAPVLFGRRMKRTTSPAGERYPAWVLVLGHVRFRITNFVGRNPPWRAEYYLAGQWITCVERASLRTALNWLEAVRNRLVKSLTPEKGR